MLQPTERFLIAGGDLSAYAAAIALARAGREVVLAVPKQDTAPEDSLLVPVADLEAALELAGGSLSREWRLSWRGLAIADGSRLEGLAAAQKVDPRPMAIARQARLQEALLAEARAFGVTCHLGVSSQGLIEDDEGRVRGLLMTTGPLLADVTFLTDPEARAWLPGNEDRNAIPAEAYICEHLFAMPGSVIASRFGLEEGEGLAVEIHLRNPHSAPRQNARVLLLSHPELLSLSIVMPKARADALNESFAAAAEAIFGQKVFAELLGATPPVAQSVRHLALGSAPLSFTRPGLHLGGELTTPRQDLPLWRAFEDSSQSGLFFAKSHLHTSPETPSPAQSLRGAATDRWPRFVEQADVFFGAHIDFALATFGAAKAENHFPLARSFRIATRGHRALPLKILPRFIAEMRAFERALGLDRLLVRELPLAIAHALKNTFTRSHKKSLLRGQIAFDERFVARALPQKSGFRFGLDYLLHRLGTGAGEAWIALDGGDEEPPLQRIRRAQRAVLWRLSILDHLAIGMVAVLSCAIRFLPQRTRPNDLGGQERLSTTENGARSHTQDSR